MTRRSDIAFAPTSAPARTALRLLPVALACTLSACGGGQRPMATTSSAAPNYAAPGPPSDPWGPYIGQAAHRFGVPQPWIRTVIKQESGGHQYMRGQPTTSDAGAMGLMQLMPATYTELAGRFGLGPDPYDPHDNIMAGTGYIRDLYGQFGSPAFLAAYNAGPHRLQLYLSGHGSLPNETVNYLASAAPGLGTERPLSGPLAAFADSAALPAPAPVLHDYVRGPSAQCWQDPDAAYDPDAPCRSAPPVRVAAIAAPAYTAPAPAYAPSAERAVAGDATPSNAAAEAAPSYRAAGAAPSYVAANDAPSYAGASAAPAYVGLGAALPYTGGSAAPAYASAATPAYAPAPAPGRASCWQDPDAAYDPTAPCRSAPSPRMAAPERRAPTAIMTAAYRPPARLQADARLAMAHAQGEPIRRAMATGRWAIQMGAYTTPGEARRTAESVRSLAPAQLGGAQAVLGTTAPFGGQVLYRARLLGLSAENAAAACLHLRAQGQACVAVAPGA